MAKKPKTPPSDTRPYECFDAESDKVLVRCWYESTAKDYCKITGAKWRKRELAA